MIVLCIDSETMEVRRYAGIGKVTCTHQGGFIPSGDRLAEMEVLERFRQNPPDELKVDKRPRFDPIKAMTMDEIKAKLATIEDPYRWLP